MTAWAQPEYTGHRRAAWPAAGRARRPRRGLGRIRARSGWVRRRTATGWSWRSTVTSRWCRCWKARTGMRPAGTGWRSAARRCGSPSAPAGWAGSATAAASPWTAARRSLGAATAPVTGCPINPVVREPPAEPVLTGVSVIDALTTLVRGPEAAGVLGSRAAAPGAGRRRSRPRPRRAATRSASCSRPWASPTPTPPPSAALEERAAAGELVLLLNTGRRAGDRADADARLALTVAEHLAFDSGPARAGGDGRHDQLLRGGARGVGRPRRDPGPPGLPWLPVQRPGFAVRAVRPDPRHSRVGHASAGADHAGRRHHPPGARPDRLHHRGPDRAVRRPARPRRLPAGRRLCLAVAADAPRRRPGPDQGRPPGRRRADPRRARRRPAGRGNWPS